MSMEWTKEDQDLLEKGFLRFKDGTLIAWSPNQEPDPVLVAFSKMKVSTKPVVILSEEEEIEKMVKDYLAWQKLKG